MVKGCEYPEETHFKDRIAIKEKKDGVKPFSFDAPHYDKRSSHYMKAGDNYGVGHRQPVGSESIKSNDAIPKGRHNTLDIYEGR